MEKLLIIGAGFLQNFLIMKAKELGIYTIAVDGNKDAPGFHNANEFEIIDIKDSKELLNFAKKKRISGVLTGATDYSTLSTNFIAQELGLIGNNLETVEIVKNKYFVRELFFREKVDDMTVFETVNSRTSINRNQFSTIFKQKSELIVKPVDGSGSRGVTKVSTFEELEFGVNLAVNNSLNGEALIEEFIEGNEYGVESIVINKEVTILSVMKKRMSNNGFYAEIGHSSHCGLDSKLQIRIEKSVKAAIRVLNIENSGVNMDIIVRDGEVFIVDIGLRMGGNLIGSHIIPLSTGIDYLSNLIYLSLGSLDKIDLEKKDNKFISSRMITFEDGTIINELDRSKFLSDKSVIDLFYFGSLGQKAKKYKTNLDNFGYIITTGDTLKESINNAENQYQLLKQNVFKEELYV